MVFGSSPLMTSSAFSDNLRVPASGFSARQLFLERDQRGRQRRRDHVVDGVVEFLGLLAGGLARRPGVACRRRRSCRWRAIGEQIVGHHEGRDRASPAPCARPRLLRRPAHRCAPSGVPSRPGMPKPMMVRQAISTGLSALCAFCKARKMSAASWPSQLSMVQPSALKRSQLVGVDDSEVAPSMVMLLSSHSTIRLVSLRWPARRDRLVADAFHQVAVAGDDIGLVIDQLVAEAGIEDALGQRHADGIGDALAQRAGGGLDAGQVAIFGMAGAGAADWRKCLMSSMVISG